MRCYLYTHVRRLQFHLSIKTTATCVITYVISCVLLAYYLHNTSVKITVITMMAYVVTCNYDYVTLHLF